MSRVVVGRRRVGGCDPDLRIITLRHPEFGWIKFPDTDNVIGRVNLVSSSSLELRLLIREVDN